LYLSWQADPLKALLFRPVHHPIAGQAEAGKPMGWRTIAKAVVMKYSTGSSAARIRIAANRVKSSNRQRSIHTDSLKRDNEISAPSDLRLTG
jgi:hypothetical protein